MGALLLAGTAGFFAGCRKDTASAPQTPAPTYVAKVGETTISQEDLVSALAKRVRALGTADERMKAEVLEELVREKVLLTKARAAGVDCDPELVRRWERMVVAKYEAEHKPDTAKQPMVSAADIEKYYREHAAEFGRPERVRVALIQIKGSAKATEEKRGELRARADKVMALTQAPEANFTELARLHSEDRATRYTGGESGWVERGQLPLHWPRELADAVFQLQQPGAVAPLVDAGGSFYVVKLLEREAAGVRPLAEVRDRIVHQLQKQATNDREQRFYAEQRSGVKVDINTTVLNAVALPAPALAKTPGEPPALHAN